MERMSLGLMLLSRARTDGPARWIDQETDMHAELALMLVTYRVAEAHSKSAAERLAAHARRASGSTGRMSRLAIRGSRPGAPRNAEARAI
jgi:hypothetical protein